MLNFLEPYLLCVGAARKLKNFHNTLWLLQAMPTTRWVWIGSNKGSVGKAVHKKILRTAKKLKVDDRVVCITDASHANIRWAYEHCSAYLQPSKAEGFGLPIIEAMLCGKPVFISNNTCQPEIGGPLANVVDNWKDPALPARIQATLEKFEKKPNLAEDSKTWAAQFNWDNTVEQYVKIYSDLLLTQSDSGE